MKRTEQFCPYVGLQPFTKREREYFFGREGEIRTIASNLFAAPLTVLYGASGVGKSSVLLAGVVPSLEASRHTAVVVFRNWQVPEADRLLKTQCLQAVEAVSKKPLRLDASLPLDELLQQAAASLSGPILIILDQFEEYFLYNPESRAENSFDAELARAVNREEVDANFLFALREDGLAKLDRFRPRIPHLLGNTLRLRHLDPASARKAIQKPLEVYQRQFPQNVAPLRAEDELIENILSQVQRGQIALSFSSGAGSTPAGAANAQIETPFLQLVLTRLWEAEVEAKSTVLRASTLQQLGGAQQIARTHLHDIMAPLSPKRAEVCARFFDRLVTPSGSKVAYSAEDLTKFAGDLAPEVPELLKTLSDARLLRTVTPAPGNNSSLRYEIFHDVLAPAILDWRQQHISAQQTQEAIKQARAVSKMRALLALTAAAILIAILTGALAYSYSVQRQHERALTDEQRQRAEMAEQSATEAKQATTAEREARARAEAAVEDARSQSKTAQEANQAYIQKLQNQLDDTRKIIERSARDANATAEQVKTYLARAETAKKELETARAEAAARATEARTANERAEKLRLEAERAKALSEANQRGAQRDAARINVYNPAQQILKK